MYMIMLLTGAPVLIDDPSRGVSLEQAQYLGGVMTRTFGRSTGRRTALRYRATGLTMPCSNSRAPRHRFFDLVKHFFDRAGVEVVIAVPATVAVGPVQAPGVAAGAVAQLGHTYLGPFGQVRAPRRAAVEDGDRVAADGCFDADVVAKAGWDPGSAVFADLGDVGLWRCGHAITLGP
jgi:hypothetical protein